MRGFFRTLLSLSAVHWLTSVGVVLTTASAAVFLILVFQRFNNPYIGIIVFLIVPAVFVLGLILMPVGVALAARQAGGYSQLLTRVPKDTAHVARLGWAFAFATLANAAILMAAGVHCLQLLGSTQLCVATTH